MDQARQTPDKAPAWDVFLSYASEDRDDVVAPLAEALTKRGYLVWYDQTAMRLGDRLRRKIENGLERSRYGVVVLSPAYFSKKWPQREFEGLQDLEASGGDRILPIWHNVNEEIVRSRSSFIADRVAVSTDLGISAIVDQIAEVLGPAATPEEAKQRLSAPTQVDSPSLVAEARSLLAASENPSLHDAAEDLFIKTVDSLVETGVRVESGGLGTIDSSGPGRFDDFVALGHRGEPSDVDTLMAELDGAGDLATIKLVDYALGYVSQLAGRARMEEYLMQGSQRQRNYAANYFRRLGKADVLDRALAAGAIDRAQTRR